MTMDRFSAASRYATLEWAVYVRADGTEVPYLRRRIISPGVGQLIGEHRVTEGERPDSIAAQRLGDAEAYWRLCDANGVLHPRDLTSEVGRKLRIELPQAEYPTLPPVDFGGGGA